MSGSGSRARTCDKSINSALLCQLSYPGLRPQTIAPRARPSHVDLAVPTAMRPACRIRLTPESEGWATRCHRRVPR